MKRFTYTDRSFGPKARPTKDQVLFSCEAETITAADTQFEQQTGHRATDSTIWTSVDFNVGKEDVVK